jgi:hypothetical protein
MVELLHASLYSRAKTKMELQVRPILRSRRSLDVPEAPRLEQGGCDGAALEKQLFQSRPDRAVWLNIVVIGEVTLALRNGIEIEVVLKVFAHAGQIVDGLDAN